MEIFVGNLPDEITAEDLRRFFAGYGDCSGFLIIKRLINGRVAHCAYGIIEPDEEARRAIRELNHREIKGRPVMVFERVVKERRRPKRTPWGGRDRRHRREWLAEPLVVEERRKEERRHGDRRQTERRVADRRSPTQKAPPPGPPGESRFNEQRVSQRRVGERRGGERRRRERRKGNPGRDTRSGI